jgi:hypothetical protein
LSLLVGLQVSVLANVGGKSIMGMLKRIFPLFMTTSLERMFSLEKPREGKMAFKPLHLFAVVCSECEYMHCNVV